MTQIQFIKELDELGLSISNKSAWGIVCLRVLLGDRVIVRRPYALADLTYQNRIDIIRECKREMGL